MPSTPCRAYGCPNLVTSRTQKGYCDTHASQRYGWEKTQKAKGNTTQRGYGHAWQQLRKQIFERDGYLCISCQQAGEITPANEIDHIINKASGGTDDPSNLQSLCTSCHKAKTQTENQKK